jgi:hypothetical protein
MIEQFRAVPSPSEQASIMTLTGLKQEIRTAVLRYFAPIAAIYEEIEKTAGILPASQRKKLDEDRAAKRE